MCDRVVVLAANPGRVQAQIPILLPHPRDRLSVAFRQVVEDIYAPFTARPPTISRPLGLPVARRLRHVSTNVLAGLLETVAAAPYGGRADLPEVAEDVQLEANESAAGGRSAADAGARRTSPKATSCSRRGAVNTRTQICRSASGFFGAPAELCAARCTHSRHSRNAAEPAGAARALRGGTEDHLSEQYARETLNAAIEWGRYAELFAYDDQSEWFSLEDVTA